MRLDLDDTVLRYKAQNLDPKLLLTNRILQKFNIINKKIKSVYDLPLKPSVVDRVVFEILSMTYDWLLFVDGSVVKCSKYKLPSINKWTLSKEFNHTSILLFGFIIAKLVNSSRVCGA
jgi:hypothetical protein